MFCFDLYKGKENMTTVPITDSSCEVCKANTKTMTLHVSGIIGAGVWQVMTLCQGCAEAWMDYTMGITRQQKYRAILTGHRCFQLVNGGDSSMFYITATPMS